MSGGLHMADFLTLALLGIRLYPFINPEWFQLYSGNLPLYQSASFRQYAPVGIIAARR